MIGLGGYQITLCLAVWLYHTTNGQLTKIKRKFESCKLILEALDDVRHDSTIERHGNTEETCPYC